MEINGFKIDKFNIHGYPENAKTHTCHLCSSDRKPQNQKVKCLNLFWDTGIGHCNHCGERFQLHTYKSNKSKKEYVRPEWHNNTQLSDKVVKWFETRGISQFTLRMMKITEGKEWMPQTKKDENTIQFNYFLDGKLINIKYRDGNKNFKLYKDAEKIFYNLDNIRTEKECIIVEGEIDCLTLIECGFHNVVSVPNGASLNNPNISYLDDYYNYFENKEKVYLSFDNDEAGQVTQKEFIRRFGPEKCKTIQYGECKDANEALTKYGKDYVIESIKNSKDVPLYNVIKFEDNYGELEDFYINGAKKGFQIGLYNFDNVFSTYTGQYIVVTGIPTSGKSDFVDMMCVGYFMKYKWKIFYVSPENKPYYLHQDKLARKIYGHRPSIHDLNSEEWDSTIGYVNEFFYFADYDRYDLKTVLEKGTELVKRKGIKVMVIDPFNKVRLIESQNKNIVDYTSDYLLEIEQFARSNDVLVILVAHPRKPGLNDRASYIPSLYDIKGGSEFYDMAPHGLLVHRNFDNDTTMVKVLKVKFSNLGENQAETFYKWNPKNGRYTPISREDAETGYIDPIHDNHNYIKIQ